MAKTTSNPKGAGRPVLEEKNERTSLFIKSSLVSDLKYIAYKEDRTRTDITNEALENYIKQWITRNGPIPKK